jgi:hypothetical protein
MSKLGDLTVFVAVLKEAEISALKNMVRNDVPVQLTWIPSAATPKLFVLDNISYI